MEKTTPARPLHLPPVLDCLPLRRESVLELRPREGTADSPRPVRPPIHPITQLDPQANELQAQEAATRARPRDRKASGGATGQGQVGPEPGRISRDRHSTIYLRTRFSLYSGHSAAKPTLRPLFTITIPLDILLYFFQAQRRDTAQ